MKYIFTKNAPIPAGHYSQAVVQGNLVFVSGQLPIDPVSGEKRTGSIEEQTEQTLNNLAEILKAANSGLDRIVKTTVYLSDIKFWSRANGVYAKFFKKHKPARAVVPTKELHHGFLVEIEAIAVVDR